MMMQSTALTLSLLLAGTVAQAASQIEVHGRSLHALTVAEASELQGRYALSDGRMLEVSRQGRRVAVVIDGRERPLLAVSATRLQSSDGRVTLDFRAAANGSVDQVQLTLATAPAAGPAAQGLAALAAPARAPSR
jgi:hypothetical protein